MSKLKFQNVHGREGSFTVNKRRYSFFNAIFEVKKDDKDLIKFFKESSGWIDYVPTAEDKVKESAKIIAKLEKEISDLKDGNDSSESDEEITNLKSEIKNLTKENEEITNLKSQADEAIEEFKKLLADASTEIEELKKPSVKVVEKK